MNRKLFDDEDESILEIETQEKLNIPAVRQRFVERREKLQKEWDYYTKCKSGGMSFNDWAHEYYIALPLRILELDYILESVV